jgi:hypothetical protein
MGYVFSNKIKLQQSQIENNRLVIDDLKIRIIKLEKKFGDIHNEIISYRRSEVEHSKDQQADIDKLYQAVEAIMVNKLTR